MRNRVISGKTRVCGVIGDPIEHTMSPVMHNAAFSELGIDYVYLPFRVRKEELGKAIAGARALNLAGLNVTIPHKVPVISFLDGLDPLAEKIAQACNVTRKIIIMLPVRLTEVPIRRRPFPPAAVGRVIKPVFIEKIRTVGIVYVNPGEHFFKRQAPAAAVIGLHPYARPVI